MDASIRSDVQVRDGQEVIFVLIVSSCASLWRMEGI